VTRLAVVLFNLGGPDSPAAVKPFLFNLFKDPAILQLPAIVRLPLAAMISSGREKVAQANYAKIGSRSPILAETEAQARALETAVQGRAPDLETRVFVAMRYWDPRAAATAKAVAAFQPDEIVLLPLYPQHSTTTTASSVKEWAKTYRGKGRTRMVCCYPTAPGLIDAHVEAIHGKWETAGRPDVRLLFSAHGLPQKVVDAGDPYAAQVAATAAAIAARLPELPDWKVCYQSRVGRLKWLEPSTEAEIRRAGADGKGAIVVPIAFVSEHVETLVELDHDYAEVARAAGCTPYLRAPTPGVQGAFIDDLAEAVIVSLGRMSGPQPFGPWLCPTGLTKCACRPEGYGEAGDLGLGGGEI
jgi:ferrochelatase